MSDKLPNFWAPNVDVLQLCNSAISVCYRYCVHLTVHIVFGFNQLSSVDFSGNSLASNDVAFCLQVKSNLFLKFRPLVNISRSKIKFTLQYLFVTKLTSCKTFIGTPIDILMFELFGTVLWFRWYSLILNH